MVASFIVLNESRPGFPADIDGGADVFPAMDPVAGGRTISDISVHMESKPVPVNFPVAGAGDRDAGRLRLVPCRQDDIRCIIPVTHVFVTGDLPLKPADLRALCTAGENSPCISKNMALEFVKVLDILHLLPVNGSYTHAFFTQL